MLVTPLIKIEIIIASPIFNERNIINKEEEEDIRISQKVTQIKQNIINENISEQDDNIKTHHDIINYRTVYFILT